MKIQFKPEDLGLNLKYGRGKNTAVLECDTADMQVTIDKLEKILAVLRMFAVAEEHE